MTEVTIQIKHLADAPAFIPLCAAWGYGQWGCHTGGSYERSLDRYTRGAQKESLPQTLIAFYEGAPAGMISLWEFDSTDRMDLSPWVAAVYVHESYRSKGIARAMLQEMEKIARGLCFPSLYLTTEQAEGLYAKTGWQVLEKTTTPFGKAKLMTKTL